MPPLTLRRPIHSLRLLFTNVRWLVGFFVGIGGWVLYVAALALAPLSLVQAVSAGGIGLLALLVWRTTGVALSRREWIGVACAVAGLVLLGISLAGQQAGGTDGSWAGVGAWLAGSVVAAGLAAGPGARLLAPGAGLGIAAGVLYAAGDVGTKAAVGGGAAPALRRPGSRLPWPRVRRAATRLPARRRARDGRCRDALHERAPDRRRDRALPRAAARWGARRAPRPRVRRRHPRSGRARAVECRRSPGAAGNARSTPRASLIRCERCNGLAPLVA